jgi:hypothetical protein
VEGGAVGHRLPLVDHPIDVRLRGARRDAVATPADHIEKMGAAVVGKRRRVDRERQEHFDALVVDVVAARHDADDMRRDSVDWNHASQGRIVTAEVVLPRRVRNDGHVFGAGSRVGRGEKTAAQRRDAEDRHQFGRHQRGIHAARPVRPEIHCAGAIPTDVLKRARPLLELGPFRQGHPEPIEVQLRKGGRDEFQLFGMRIRERSQQDAVDHAEDRRVRADAEREGEDAESRVARTPGQGPKGVLEVMLQRLHVV